MEHTSVSRVALPEAHTLLMRIGNKTLHPRHMNFRPRNLIIRIIVIGTPTFQRPPINGPLDTRYVLIRVRLKRALEAGERTKSTSSGERFSATTKAVISSGSRGLTRAPCEFIEQIKSRRTRIMNKGELVNRRSIASSIDIIVVRNA